MTHAREESVDARRYVPDTDDLGELARAVQSCRGCELYRGATQAVFGSKPGDAKHVPLMLLGEQPGDVEDKRGEPFVGPAGGLLRRALSEVGVDEVDTYMTNAVKHFRWRADPRGGKRRIHQRPDAGHVRACRPWWQAEVRLLRPAVLVALGATAGEALFGSSFRVGAARGHVLAWTLSSGDGDGRDGSDQDGIEVQVVPTVHPSSVLRAPDRDDAFAAFVEDLRRAADVLSRQAS